jgi:hypothetical protein
MLLGVIMSSGSWRWELTIVFVVKSANWFTLDAFGLGHLMEMSVT